MKQLVAFIFLAGIMTVFSAAAQNRLIKKDKPLATHPISSIIKKNDSTLKIDKNVIIENKNLPFFIRDLQSGHLAISDKSEKIPTFIKSFLRQLSQDEFTIADFGEDWNCCCDRNDKLPNRQLISFGNGNGMFFINYLTGGIGTMGHVILIKYYDSEVTDLRFGNATINMKNTAAIIQYLINNKHKNPGFSAI